MKKWNNRIDNWFEEKVWTKVPEEHASPHFFFVCGIIFAFLILLTISAFM